jgi:hypothetical protein
MQAASTAASTAVQTAVPQHLEALEHANRVRLARAALKRRVRAGELGAHEVVRSCPWEAETMSVSELLRSQSRWGRTRTRKFLLPLAISENRQLGRLTARQREMLAAALEAKQPRGRDAAAFRG